MIKRIFYFLITIQICTFYAYSQIFDFINYRSLDVFGAYEFNTPGKPAYQTRLVRFYDRRTEKYGFKKGREIVLKAQFDEADEGFSEGMARVRKGKYWGFVSHEGKIAVSPRFLDIISLEKEESGLGDGWIEFAPRQFNEGLAAIRVWHLAKFGFIDKTGKIVIQPIFDAAGDFSEGLARVKIGEKWGFVDKTGKVVIEPQFEDLDIEDIFDVTEDYAPESFFQGLARVRVGQKWGFINKTGNFKIRPQYDAAQKFSEGFAAVKLGRRWRFIDKEGNLKVEAPRRVLFIGFLIRGKADAITKNTQDPQGALAGQAHLLGKIDIHGRLTNLLPLDDMGGGGPTTEEDIRAAQLECSFESTPGNASVYLIPRVDWDDANNGADILNDQNRLQLYLISGVTPFSHKAYQQRYWLIFELDGRREKVSLDVTGNGTNKAFVRFR